MSLLLLFELSPLLVIDFSGVLSLDDYDRGEIRIVKVYVMTFFLVLGWRRKQGLWGCAWLRGEEVWPCRGLVEKISSMALPSSLFLLLFL